ncbi:MAG: PIN domain-containing protein [Verrucomicrobiota bacterium]
MRVLIDTNIYLDVALRREGFAQASLGVIQKVVSADGLILLAPHSLATIYYLCERHLGKEPADGLIGDLLGLAQIASFEHQDALRAFKMDYKDFEDAMIFAAAIANQADFLITRNFEDFDSSFVDAEGGYELKVRTPDWFLGDMR